MRNVRCFMSKRPSNDQSFVSKKRNDSLHAVYVKFLPLLVSQTQLYYPVIDSHPLDCVTQQ